MNQRENTEPSQYILDAFEPSGRFAILALNRRLRGAVQRITSAEKAASRFSSLALQPRERLRHVG